MKKAIAVFVVMAILAAFADNPHITQLIELIDVAISSPQNGDVLTFNSSTGKWNNQQPSGQDGPKTVLRYQQENVFGPTTPITLFTPNETAMYRGNVKVITPLADTCSGIGDQVIANITDVDGASLASGAGFLGRGNTNSGQTQPFRGIAGSPWTLSTISGFPDFATSNCPYSFYIVVEKL